MFFGGFFWKREKKNYINVLNTRWSHAVRSCVCHGGDDDMDNDRNGSSGSQRRECLERNDDGVKKEKE